MAYRWPAAVVLSSLVLAVTAAKLLSRPIPIAIKGGLQVDKLVLPPSVTIRSDTPLPVVVQEQVTIGGAAPLAIEGPVTISGNAPLAVNRQRGISADGHRAFDREGRSATNGDLLLHHDRQRGIGADGDTGRKHQLVDLQSALNRDGDGPTQKLGGRDRQNQAGQHNRCRPAIRHQQITAGNRPLSNGLSALQRV